MNSTHKGDGWVTDPDALLTIRELGLSVGDEVKLAFHDADNWTGVELRLIGRDSHGRWDVKTIRPARNGVNAKIWDPESSLPWELIGWRRLKQ